MILQTTDNIPHIREVREPFKLTQHLHGLRHHFQILLRQRSVCDTIILVFVFIVFVIIYHDRGIITQFLATHHLYIHLNRAPTDSLRDPLVLVQGIGTRVNQIFERPSSIFITQAVIYCFITD